MGPPQNLNRRVYFTTNDRFCRERPRRGVAPLPEDHELASRLVFPAKADVGAERAGPGVVLQQRRHEHARRQVVRGAAADQRRREPSLRKVDAIDRHPRLDGELFRELDPPLIRGAGASAVVEAAGAETRGARDLALRTELVGQDALAERIASDRQDDVAADLERCAQRLLVVQVLRGRRVAVVQHRLEHPLGFGGLELPRAVLDVVEADLVRQLAHAAERRRPRAES
jgi:hypothetical protein